MAHSVTIYAVFLLSLIIFKALKIKSKDNRNALALNILISSKKDNKKEKYLLYSTFSASTSITSISVFKLKNLVLLNSAFKVKVDL